MARVSNKLQLVDYSSVVGELVWYQNPGWQKHQISTDFKVRTDLAVGDINNDGRNDIVVLADERVIWLANPSWTATEIITSKEPARFHDVEISDLDRDGDVDVVLRNQSLFGFDGDRLHILTQESGEWRETMIAIDHGEGLRVFDINGDEFDDIVVNNVWLKNPVGAVATRPWTAIDYTSEWEWPNVQIAVNDINSDGSIDILLTPAEPAGEFYRISWFEGNSDDESIWLEHVIDEELESVHHASGAGDFDGDGDIDIFTAEMNQGDDPDEVKVYLNNGEHTISWSKVVLSELGSHNLQIADLDGDDDVEIFGTNWQFEDYDRDYPVYLWDSASKASDGWIRYVIADNDPWRNLFVYAADLNGDQFADIVAGRCWFENPGIIDGNWRRHELPDGLNSALYVDDFDNDGFSDVFGSAWDGTLSEPGYLIRAEAKLKGSGFPGSGNGGEFYWAKNDGNGNFSLYNNIEKIEGDHLQGITKLTDLNSTSLLLSWHQKGKGIHRITIPADPSTDRWTAHVATSYSQDEQISSFDVNGDGRADVVTGTTWIDSSAWQVNHFSDSEEFPDRHEIVDIDSDGDLDAVVGYQAVSNKGRLVIYRNISSMHVEEQVIDLPIGPMSLDVGDIDDDGDIDIVVGEHNLDNPRSARLLLFKNQSGDGRIWQRSSIGRGDEHHNGVLLEDLDLDGDKDIISIGWGHSDILVYENRQSFVKD
jgi:hypothetical protein